MSYLTSDEESHTVPYCPSIHGITTSQVISQGTGWQIVRNHSGAGWSFPLCTHGRPPNFSSPSLQLCTLEPTCWSDAECYNQDL